ncbi:MAG: hypothetical protein KJ072_26550 [Verrucomicrobia bacterium]|nr:hypothetical protein [Verrucomicrobiota bacterium]
MHLAPPEAVAVGAAWRLLGESTWRDSGVAYGDLPFGQHFLEFKPVDGWMAPVSDRPVLIAEGLVTGVGSPSYRLIPRYPIVVTTTGGGFVEEEAWSPAGFSALHPFGDNSPSGLNRAWERARREQPRPMTMPFENFGWRVRMRAMAFPGYQFAGWSGDFTGTRNPTTFIVHEPRRIVAHFVPTGMAVSATHQAESCASPGTATIHAQFSYPPGEQLEQLEWKPALPTGWTLLTAVGLGGPRVEGDALVFEGPLGHNPVQFNLRVAVPSGEIGLKTIAGEAIYSLKGEAQSAVQTIDARALTVQPSTAARLELALDSAAGHPRLRVEGVVGKTYSIEQTIALWPPSGPPQLWAFLGDITLTNTSEIFIDPFPLATVGGIYYRASIVE